MSDSMGNIPVVYDNELALRQVIDIAAPFVG